MDEKQLVHLFRSQRTGKRRRGWSCPGEARLAAFADGHLNEPARQRVEEHLADCDFCLEQVSFLIRLQTAEVPTDIPEALLDRARELSAVGERVSLVPALRWAGLTAAGVALVLGLAVWLREPYVPVVPPQPSPPSIEIPFPPTSAPAAPPVAPRSVRNAQRQAPLPELLSPREGSVISSEHLEFRWQEVPRSLFYEIHIVTEDGNLVWESRVETSLTHLPADIQLVPGQKYFLWVQAYLPESKRVKSSPVGFTVKNN